ncbi:MAG: hypothetical protein OXG06_03990, partial [Gammaproteobacteria bacterium]|nr:hypothetical protein [Gammaproteobacteria bacterium]
MDSTYLSGIFGGLWPYDISSAWVIQVFVVVFAVLLFNSFVSLFLRRLEKNVQRSANPWDDAFIYAVRKPLQVLIWVVGILFAADIVASRTEAEIFKAINPVRDISVIAILTWFL